MKKATILFAFLMLSFNSFSQNDFLKKSDSLRLTLKVDTLEGKYKYYAYQRILNFYMNGPYDSLWKYTDELIEWCLEENNPLFLYASTFMKARAYRRYEDFELSKKWYFKSLFFAEKLDNSKVKIAKIYSELGAIYRDQDSLISALEYLKKAEVIFEEEQSKSDIRFTKKDLASLMVKIQRYRDAISYYNQALKLAENKKDSAGAYHDLYGPYALLENYDSAKYFLSKALSMTETGSPSHYIRLVNYTHLYLESKYHGYNPSLALVLLDSIEKTYLSVYSNTQDSITYYLNAAFAHLLLKHIPEAKQHIDSYEILLQKNKNKINTYKYKWLLSEYYKRVGEYKKAYINYFEYDSLKESYTNAKVSNQLYMLSKKYELERRDKEITALKFEKEKKELEASLYYNQRNAVFIFSFIFLLAAFIIARLAILRKRSNKMLENRSAELEIALSEKDILFKEIHHRVKNNLQIISSLLRLQANSLSDSAAMAAIEEGQHRVKSMSLIHQKLYQKEDLRGVDVQDYLENLISELMTSFGIDNNSIKIDLRANKLKLDVDTLVPLGLILNELITNSLKYAFDKDIFSPELKIYLEERNNILNVRVSDNGKGISKEKLESSNSFGWKLIKSLARKLKADYHIISKNGTHVDISVSRYKLII